MADYIRTPFANTGDKTAIPVAAQPDDSVSYEKGFPLPYQLDPDTDPTALDIPRNQFNQLMFMVTAALQQYQQLGFPDFITSAQNGGVAYSYSINATVRFTGGWAGAGAINYYSLADANTADPTDPSKWGLVQYAATPASEITGVVKEYYGSTLPDGYVWANGTTIGDASSGATGRANADTETAFTLLWNSTSNVTFPIQTSAGAASTRGANAAADFAAHKRMPVPDRRDVNSVGKTDMGGATARGLLTQAVTGFDPAVLGALGGTQSVALTANQNGTHSHTGSTASNGTHTHTAANSTAGSHRHSLAWDQGGAQNLPGPGVQNGTMGNGNDRFVNDTNTMPNAGDHTHDITVDSAGAHTHDVTIGNSGLGSAHLNVQPTTVANFIFKL